MSERTLPAWATANDEEVTWLDDDHAVTWTQWSEETEPHGGILWHTKPDGAWCCGAWYIHVPLYQGEPLHPVELWTLVSKEPLSLSPSFLCHCGHHGWIKEGKWIPA